jgi:hypothetical protein
MLRPRELTYAQGLRQELSRHTPGLCRQDRRRTRHGAKLWHQHRKPRLGENLHVSGASEKAGLEHAVIDRVVQSGKDETKKPFRRAAG